VSATQSVILTREDAVKTQLDTAIWLWFIEEQIGPIHALADNALTILNDIGGKVGKESQLYSKAMHEVHGRDRLKGFSNFLKHGSKDANAAYKFPLLWTEGLMLDAINLCAKIFPPVSLLMATFTARTMCIHWAARRLNPTNTLRRALLWKKSRHLDAGNFLRLFCHCSLKGDLSSPDGLKSDRFVNSSALGDFI